MAEPEELDEDLFADLYDEQNVPAQPGPPSTAPAPPVVDAPASNGNGMSVDQTMQGNRDEQNNDMASLPQINVDSGQDGNAGSGWQDGNDLARNGHQYDDPMGESDTHGTGIKEDG